MTYDEMRVLADRVRGIPLRCVLIAMDAQQDPSDASQWQLDAMRISITGPKFMDWSCAVGGGGAIDLAMHMKGLDFKDAVHWLMTHFAESASPVETRAMRVSQASVSPEPMRRNLDRVRAYLTVERALPASLLESLIDSGSLYADARGNAVFILRDQMQQIVGAELRGTGPLPWRGMASGSKKDAGYFSVPVTRVQAIVLCESAIDAMSCHVLQSGRLSISTAGARPNPLWLGELLNRRIQIYCGFDADPTGDQMADRMISDHPSIKRLRPCLHDWNDVLSSDR